MRGKSALIVVDMQKDFCHEDGRLYVGESVKKIIPNIRFLIEKAKEKEIPIVFTQDWHRRDDREFDVWGEHCIEGTEGAEIIDEVKTEGYVVRKRRYSAFFGTDLDLCLRENKIETLVICGVVTNICVLHTAGDAVLRGYKVVIPKDCVAALRDYDQEYGLYHMDFLFKALITDSDKINFD
ncbi:MAG: cysteine hydrolase family protein [Candidatus Syntropharchaeia archaeon]